MDILTTMKKRRSIRAFTQDRIPKEKLDRILEAAWLAPVGMNDYASLHLSVIQDKELLAELSKAASEMYRKPEVDFYYGAPVVILLSSKENKYLPNIQYANAGCVIENMMLAATELDLGSVYLYGNMASIIKNPQLLAKLKLPEGYTPVSAVALGVAAQLPHEKPEGETIKVSYL